MLSPLARKARVNRRKISISDLHDPSDSRSYWMRQPARKRLEALELLRQSAHAYDPAAARLQRLLKVVKRKRD
jgi:hypothetical protein